MVIRLKELTKTLIARGLNVTEEVIIAGSDAVGSSANS
jgi:hypothetical protein